MKRRRLPTSSRSVVYCQRPQGPGPGNLWHCRGNVASRDLPNVLETHCCVTCYDCKAVPANVRPGLQGEDRGACLWAGVDPTFISKVEPSWYICVFKLERNHNNAERAPLSINQTLHPKFHPPSTSPRLAPDRAQLVTYIAWINSGFWLSRPKDLLSDVSSPATSTYSRSSVGVQPSAEGPPEGKCK